MRISAQSAAVFFFALAVGVVSGAWADGPIDGNGASSYWIDGFGVPGTDDVVFAGVGDTFGNLFVGGDFTVAGNVAANHIAKWDPCTSTWSALGTGTNDRVDALAVDSSGNLYAAGPFTTAGGVSAHHLAKWDGTGWSALGTGRVGSVNALAVDGADNVYAGGRFSSIGGVAANSAARWDGMSWSALGNGVSGDPYTILVHAILADASGAVYVAGEFTMAGNTAAKNIARWDGATWTDMGAGIDSSPYLKFYVTILADDDSGNLYAGVCCYNNMFDYCTRVAKWDGTNWSFVGTCADQQVHAIALDLQGNVYAGGYFGEIGGVEAKSLAKWDGSGWTPMGTELWYWSTLPTVNAILINGLGEIYVGGFFWPPTSFQPIT